LGHNGAKIGQRKTLQPILVRIKALLYTSHLFSFVFVVVVQNLAKRKTLCPILVRINALYTLRTSFFSSSLLLSLWCKNKPKEKHCTQHW
jgi:hypothetical protein